MGARAGKEPLLIKEYIMDIGKVKVYDNYMVTIFNGGTTLNLDRAYQLIGISEVHFRNINFGFISLRTFSYAVDPTIYSYLRRLDNLKAFAIVSLKEVDMHNFDIEKLFYKKNMKFFIEYGNAVNWIKHELNEFNNSKILTP